MLGNGVEVGWLVEVLIPVDHGGALNANKGWGFRQGLVEVQVVPE